MMILFSRNCPFAAAAETALTPATRRSFIRSLSTVRRVAAQYGYKEKIVQFSNDTTAIALFCDNNNNNHCTISFEE